MSQYLVLTNLYIKVHCWCHPFSGFRQLHNDMCHRVLCPCPEHALGSTCSPLSPLEHLAAPIFFLVFAVVVTVVVVFRATFVVYEVPG